MSYPRVLSQVIEKSPGLRVVRDFHTPGSSVVIIQSRVLARVAKSAELDMSSPRIANGSLGTWLALAYLELSYRQWLELNTLESSLGVRGGFCLFCSV